MVLLGALGDRDAGRLVNRHCARTKGLGMSRDGETDLLHVDVSRGLPAHIILQQRTLPESSRSNTRSKIPAFNKQATQKSSSEQTEQDFEPSSNSRAIAIGNPGYS